MSDLKNHLQRNLESLMREKGVKSQTELSDLSGVGFPQVNAYLNGRAKPRLETLERLAAGLGVELWELLRDPDKPPTKREVLRVVAWMYDRTQGVDSP